MRRISPFGAAAVASMLALVIVSFVVAFTRPAGGAPVRAPTMLSAVVFVEPTTQQATLVRGNGVTDAVWIGTDGFYTVTFNRDVSSCAYVATAGVPYSNSVADDDVILDVAPALDNNTGLPAPNGVSVEEWDGGLNAPHGSTGFHLIVEC
jgi:hypothetical protein